MISWCLPVGDHHDDILTILASSCNLDHLVALALVGSLLNVHLLQLINEMRSGLPKQFKSNYLQIIE